MFLFEKHFPRTLLRRSFANYRNSKYMTCIIYNILFFPWPADQYDKLSPYGIFISGCIDG